MNRQSFRSLFLFVAFVASVALFQQSAQAGPPLLCHPFDIGTSKSLPWAGKQWRDVQRDYDIRRLTTDTLALLTAETPVIVRMETLRRATIYAVWSRVDREVGYPVSNLDVARELLVRLKTRIADAKSKGANAESLAQFDYGYLIETYRQAASGNDVRALLQGLDGYNSVAAALRLCGSNPEMEFAAAVIAVHPRRNELSAHLQKASAGAKSNAMLARNLDELTRRWNLTRS